MKQTDRVLAYIEFHGSISDLEALREIGIRRLAARVWDLRAAGHDIRTRPEHHEGGSHARYLHHPGCTIDPVSVPVPVAAGHMARSTRWMADPDRPDGPAVLAGQLDLRLSDAEPVPITAPHRSAERRLPPDSRFR